MTEKDRECGHCSARGICVKSALHLNSHTRNDSEDSEECDCYDDLIKALCDELKRCEKCMLWTHNIEGLENYQCACPKEKPVEEKFVEESKLIIE